MDSINDILSSLTENDLNELSQMASELFGTGEKQTESKAETPDFSELFENAQMMSKIASLFSAMNKRDDKSRLIEALKPLLSEERRKKADEAMQLLKVMDMLPIINSVIGGDKK